MRLHRFYISEPIGLKTELTIDSPELVNQIRRVFRLKAGDSIVVFDGSGSDYECVIDKSGEKNTIVSDAKIQVRVVSAKRSAFLPARKVFLYAAVVKKDTFEWIVEKATELGVTDIIPVMAERSEKKNLNEERLKKIAIEASEQSGRGTISAIHPIVGLKEATEQVKDGGRSKEEGEMKPVAFHLEGQGLKTHRSDLNKLDIACFIGPEGGWSDDEVALFHSNEIPVISLGSQVLRAETAVVAALSVIMLGE